jgi:hypothetical protein
MKCCIFCIKQTIVSVVMQVSARYSVTVNESSVVELIRRDDAGKINNFMIDYDGVLVYSRQVYPDKLFIEFTFPKTKLDLITAMVVCIPFFAMTSEPTINPHPYGTGIILCRIEIMHAYFGEVANYIIAILN